MRVRALLCLVGMTVTAAPSFGELATTWIRFPASSSCTGPTDGNSSFWTDALFDEGEWTTVELPDSPSGGADVFYRGHFNLTGVPSDLYFFFQCDDGCDVFVNGTPLGSYGPNGSCHALGCVNFPGCGSSFNQCVTPQLLNTSDLVVGENVIGVHVSNGAGGFGFQSVLFQGDPAGCGNCAILGAEQCDPTAPFNGPFCSNAACGLPGNSNACSCDPLPTSTETPTGSPTPTATAPPPTTTATSTFTATQTVTKTTTATATATLTSTFPPVAKRPRITSLSPNAGVPGDLITAFGDNFGKDAIVTLGSTNITPTTRADSFIQFIVPALSPGKYTLKVSTALGSASQALDVLGRLPLIESIQPRRNLPGSMAWIDGHNFGTPQGSSSVQIGGLPADITFWGDKHIELRIPNLGNRRHPVVINTAGGTATTTVVVWELIFSQQHLACDESFLGNIFGGCQVISVVQSPPKQRQTGQVVDLTIENLREAWYQLDVYGVPAYLNRPFDLEPRGRIVLRDVPVGSATTINFLVDRTTDRAVQAMTLDLLSLALTGNHFTEVGKLETLFGGNSPLALFLLDLAADVRNLVDNGVTPANISRIGLNLLELPSLAGDPIVKDILKTSFHVSRKQFKALATIAWIVQIDAAINQEALTLVTPGFDYWELTAR